MTALDPALFLPDPEPRTVHATVISVDDHVVEPPHTFEGRVPRKFADRAPRVVDTDGGGQTWMYDGHSLPNVGFNAVVGRPVSEYGFEPARFDEMRRGAWDIHARIRDMDLNGVYASVCFPSSLPGFAGQRYRSTRLGSIGFDDVFDDFLAFIEPRLRHVHRLLAPHGSFFLHIDYREAHYCKVLLDAIFGRECFVNEIVWAYDYGGRPRRRWPAKHDTILWYARDPERYTFNYDAIDRIPYMAPRLVGAEKAARGKTPTDVWWQTIVPTAGRERTGYPTQKPLKILERIVAVHSNPGERVLDFFAGSGTTGEAAARAGRDFVLVDHSEEALAVMTENLTQDEAAHGPG